MVFKKFTSGTQAHDILFQAYFLDGIGRWNEDRAAEAAQYGRDEPHTYSGFLRHAANILGEEVLGKKISPSYQQPFKYTGNIMLLVIYKRLIKLIGQYFENTKFV